MKLSPLSTVRLTVLYQGVKVSNRRGDLRPSIIISLEFEWCKGESNS
jgi:hypothetical protein